MKFLGSREVRIAFLVLAAVASAIPAAATDFYTVSPCRVYDSRGNGGPLDQGTTYSVTVAGVCGVPATATAVALNVTIIGANGSGEMAVFPAGSPPPFVGMLAFKAGRTQAVLQLVGVGTGGQVSFRATIPPPPPNAKFHFVIDVSGYYMAAKAVADAATVTEDAAPTTINVLANDLNPNAETLTIGSATDPANGTVVIAGDNLTLTYEPDPDYCNDPPGTTLDTFNYTIAQSGSTATVTVKVTCVNDAPDAVDDAATVLEDAAATPIDVLANDADAENDPFTIASASDPANGTVVLTGGSPGAHTGLTYQPDADYCGADSFTYTLSPGGDTATVSVTVTCVEGNPVAVDDAATVGEDAAATPIDVLANDTDEEGDPFFIASASDPANGTVVLTGGTPGAHTGLTYQPDANYCGADSFTYALTPGGDTATVSVTVTCVDDIPNAVDDAATVAEDAAATPVSVLANDADPEGDAFFIASASDPANGTVVLTGGSPGAHTGLTYQPDANYCGADSFTYTLTPGGDTATVSVTVTCVDGAPVAGDDVATVAEDAAATPVDVLLNDTDEEGDPFFIASASDPANGTVVLTGGTPGAHTGLTYQPDANYCGPDSFTYSLTPGGDTATVLVTVTCVNDGPAIDLDADDDKGTGGSDFAITFTEGDAAKLIEDPVDAIVTDVDTATLASLTVTLTNLLDAGAELLDADLTGVPGITKSYDTTTDPLKGVLVLTGPDTLANFQTVLRKVTYRNTDTDPDTTPRVIEFVANDGSTDGTAATSTVTVAAVDSPPVAVDDAATVAEDASATAIDVLANDTDAENDPILIASASDPANGTVVLTGGSPGAHTGLTYQPDPNYCGADSFTYTLTPGGDTATVSVTVTCVDDNPVAVADVATVAEDASATTIDVLANDTDADGGAKTIASATDPANGTVVIAGDNLSLTYQPDPNYCNTPPGTTLDTFNYTLNGGSSTTVTVTVTCVDDNPVAVADSATVVEDAGATLINVLANDTDVDGGTKTIASATDPANGTVVIAGDNLSLTYQPDPNYCNSVSGIGDTFNYTLNGGSSTTVTVTVTCVDDPPVAVADAQTVLEDAAATAIPVLANDTDIDAGPKTISSATDPANGTVVLTGGSPGAHTGLTYQPDPNYCNDPPGTTLDTFTYTLNGGSSTTVTMTVTCVNDAPVLGDATIDYTILGNTQLRVGETTPGNSLLHIRDNVDVDEKSLPTDVDGPGPLTVVPFTGNSANGGNVVLNADGTFTYESAAGFTGIDTFPFTVTDNGAPAATATGTVSITVSETVWFVHDVTGPNNPELSDTGRSTNAFEDLEDVAAVLTDNDYIFVFRGTTNTAPHGGIRINKTGVKLHGEGVGLTVPGFGALVPAGSQPFIDNAADVPAQEDHGVAVDASAASLTGVEIRGLVIEGRDNGVDVTAIGANNVGLTISNNTITSDAITGLEGVDVNANGTGTVTVTVSNNSLNGRGNAFDARTAAAGALRIDLSNNTNIFSNASGVVIDGAGGGTTTITGFANNSVHPNTGGTGISVNAATFDVTPGGSFQTVTGGSSVVGVAGNGVGAQGFVLTNVTGDLSFTDLDVFADGGAGLRVSGTGAVNVGAGTGTRVTVGAGVGIVEANGGPAVDINNATVDLQLTSLKSTTPNTGVSLVNVSDGTTPAMFSAGSGSSITASSGAGPAFNVSGGNAGINYGGTITNNGTGRAVSITTWSGDDASDDLLLSGAIDENGAGILLNGNGGTRAITFSGGMDIDTTTGEGFAATSNTNTLGLHVTGTNTVDSISATALRVTSTTIGSSHLNFRSISSGNNTAAADPANGIVLNATGTSGGLKVAGTGAAGSGGTIQRTTGVGILLTSTAHVSLASMNVQNSGDDGIRGLTVTNLELNGCNLSTNGNATAENGLQLGEASGSVVGITGNLTLTNTNITASAGNNVHIRNTSGTLASMNISGGSFNDLNDTTGANSFLFEMSGTAVTTAASINGAAFSNNSPQRGLEVQAHETGLISDFLVSGTTFNNNGIHVSFTQDTNSNLTFRMLNNTSMLNAAPLHAINVFSSSTSTGGSITGTIQGNVIGNAAVGSGSSTGNGIRVVVQGRTSATLLIDGNTIRQTPGGRAIDMQFLGHTTSGLGIVSTNDVTLTNNNVQNNGTSFPLAAIFLAADNQGSPARVRADIRGNVVPATGSFDYPTFDGNAAQLIFEELTGATAELVDTPPASANATAQLTSTNTGTAYANGGVALIAGPINTP